VQKRQILIGRARGCDIHIADPTVSQLHCEVLLEDGLCIIQDVKSRNGLYVNDVHVQRAILWPGMWVFIGESELVAVSEDGMVPITAMSHTSFLGKAAMYHGSPGKAAKSTGKSKSTILRALKRFEDRDKEHNQ
jgi:pSer/pThr/pTyr-binding forkhead associated (FHA) protein